jgi:hypothetical protein
MVFGGRNVEWSVNWMFPHWPVKLKAAASGTGTACDVPMGHPFESTPLYDTVNHPAWVKRCDGFVIVDVLFAPLAGSPKFQVSLVTPPDDEPLNATGLQIGAVTVKLMDPTGEHGPGRQVSTEMVMVFDVELHP